MGRAKQHSRFTLAGSAVGSPSARELLSNYFSSDEDECADMAMGLLEQLEGANSLLASMFKRFLKDAHLKPAAREGAKKRSRDSYTKEVVLLCSLEELYCGTTKLLTVQRTVHDGKGHTVPVQQQLRVKVQPGLKQGAQMTIPGLGHGDGWSDMSDLTVVVQQKLHPSFRRLADDLYAIVDVPLVTALTGGPVTLRTLSGQLLQLPVQDDIITPGSEMTLPNLGMPVFGDSSGRRGALHVKFRVSFPQQLNQQQQVLLRHALEVSEPKQGQAQPATGQADLSLALSGNMHLGQQPHRHWQHWLSQPEPAMQQHCRQPNSQPMHQCQQQVEGNFQ